MFDVPRVSPEFEVQQSCLRMVWPLVYLTLLTIPAAAQAGKVTPIAEVIRNRPDHSAARNGETFTVIGVVTEGCHDVGYGKSLSNLEDSSGGIALFGEHAVLPPGAFHLGDVLQATGKLSQYRGMEELLVEEVHRTGTASPPAPHDVLAAQVLGEDYSGQLVRVTGQLVPSPNGGVTLRDRSGSVLVYLLHSFFQNTSFMQRLVQGGPVEIVGFARQRTEPGQPPDSGYLLAPRDEQDFKFGSRPMYREMVVAGFLVLGGFVYLWLRRRAAEKRARALSVLSENLKESDERFRQMAESIDQIFWMLDAGTNRILYASPAFERVWGRGSESIAERDNLLDAVHPDDRERVAEYLKKSTSEVCTATYRIVRPDGAVRWIFDRAFPVLNHDGKLYRITGTSARTLPTGGLWKSNCARLKRWKRLAGSRDGIAHPTLTTC